MCVCLWILVSVGQIRRVKRKRVDLAEATPHGCWPTNGLDVNGAPVRPLLPIHRGGGPRFQQFSNHLQKWTNSHKTLKTLNEDSTTKRLCLSRFVQLFFYTTKMPLVEQETQRQLHNQTKTLLFAMNYFIR